MPSVLFRPIKAKQSDFRVFYKEIEKALDNTVKPELLTYFNNVIKDWNNQVQFAARKRILLEMLEVYVYPTGENADIWRYVTLGTRPHVIKPKGQGYPLKFNWGGYKSYKPRTTTSGGYKRAWESHRRSDSPIQARQSSW